MTNFETILSFIPEIIAEILILMIGAGFGIKIATEESIIWREWIVIIIIVSAAVVFRWISKRLSKKN